MDSMANGNIPKRRGVIQGTRQFRVAGSYRHYLLLLASSQFFDKPGSMVDRGRIKDRAEANDPHGCLIVNFHLVPGPTGAERLTQPVSARTPIST